MSEKDLVRDFEFKKYTSRGFERGSESVAVEELYELIVNGKFVESVFITPSNLREFAYGHLFSEGIARPQDRVTSVEVKKEKIHVSLDEAEKPFEEKEPCSTGGVGFDGKSDTNGIKTKSSLQIRSGLVFQILQHLDTGIYRKTSGTHSATLVNKENEALARAVDVSRHNACDKVIGKGILKGIDLSESILLTSGRQSQSMVMKAVRTNIPIIVTKAAPLSSGVEAADKKGVTLICFADERKFKVFSGEERIF